MAGTARWLAIGLVETLKYVCSLKYGKMVSAVNVTKNRILKNELRELAWVGKVIGIFGLVLYLVFKVSTLS